jgi:hypothetical protein
MDDVLEESFEFTNALFVHVGSHRLDAFHFADAENALRGGLGDEEILVLYLVDEGLNEEPRAGVLPVEVPGLEDEDGLETVDGLLLHQFHFREKAVAEVDLCEVGELRVGLDGVEEHGVGGLAEGALGGVSQGRQDEGQVLAEEQAGYFLAHHVGNDLIQQHDTLVVDFLLVLLVEGLQLVEHGPEMVYKLLLVGSC